VGVEAKKRAKDAAAALDEARLSRVGGPTVTPATAAKATTATAEAMPKKRADKLRRS